MPGIAANPLLERPHIATPWLPPHSCASWARRSVSDGRWRAGRWPGRAVPGRPVQQQEPTHLQQVCDRDDVGALIRARLVAPDPELFHKAGRVVLERGVLGRGQHAVCNARRLHRRSRRLARHAGGSHGPQPLPRPRRLLRPTAAQQATAAAAGRCPAGCAARLRQHAVSERSGRQLAATGAGRCAQRSARHARRYGLIAAAAVVRRCSPALHAVERVRASGCSSWHAAAVTRRPDWQPARQARPAPGNYQVNDAQTSHIDLGQLLAGWKRPAHHTCLTRRRRPRRRPTA